MRVAEALILRSDYQKRIEQLKQRLLRVAKVQEGERPPEDPADLIQQFEEVAADLTLIVQRINRTNSTTAFDAGRTLADALAERDTFRTKQAAYRELAQAASVTQTRISRSEVRFESTVNIADIQRQADQYARDHRELDAKIQEMNWTTDLLD